MVLQSIAKEIKSWLPGDQMQVFRLGGDEFAVVMPGTEKEEAFLTLEQLRLRIQGLDKLGQLQPAPTVSIGIASYPDDAGTRQELIRKADDALYRAKTTGRNKVGLAREEKKVPKTSHYTQGQLERLSTLSSREGVGEAELLREALDDLLKKYAS
jgi:PleD family two-component response regulator